MNHAVIFAHPKPDSFTGSVARAYQRAATALNHSVIVRDLYGLGFDPRLAASELGRDSYDVPPDVAEERALLREIDVFVLVYPLWLYAPPAMMKGYLERVFGFGFAYGPGGTSANPMLGGRKLMVLTSSGLSKQWGTETGAFDALGSVFDRYFASVCGLELLEHLHLGNIAARRPEEILGYFRDVERAVNRHFSVELSNAHKDFRGIAVNRPPLADNSKLQCRAGAICGVEDV